MRKFNSPLDNIRVSSPCAANWDEMLGTERKRYCGDCKLNVYNLSDMTRVEAERLLNESEGRLCVQYYRRADGTVLTKNCPVGWQAVRARISRVATAAFSIMAGLCGGLFAFSFLKDRPTATIGTLTVEPRTTYIRGDVSPSLPHNTGVMGMPVLGERVVPVQITPKKQRLR